MDKIKEDTESHRSEMLTMNETLEGEAKILAENLWSLKGAVDKLEYIKDEGSPSRKRPRNN